jgi:hypothetical protein
LNLKQFKDKYFITFILSIVISVIWYFYDINQRLISANESVLDIMEGAIFITVSLILSIFFFLFALRLVFDGLYDFLFITEWKKHERARYLIVMFIVFALFAGYTLWEHSGR